MGHHADERAELESKIKYWRKRWSLGQKGWSFVNHFVLFGAAIISVAIGFIVQIKTQLFENLSNDTLSTILAFCAAGLSGIAAAGGFDRKWKANRLSRGRLDALRIDFMDSNVDLRSIRERLKEILRIHDQEILGGEVQTSSINAFPQSKQKSDSSANA